MLRIISLRLCTLLFGGIILISLSACTNSTAEPNPPVAQNPPTAISAGSTPTAELVPPEPTAETSAPTPPEPTSEPNPITDPITGAPALARGSVTQRPYAVMIDNHPDAYPQSGMDHAAVVFEALAEFGITRFIAIYAPGITPDVSAIGPVRSTRLYFAEWAMGFHPLYVHAGGSPQGIELVEQTDQLINLDALHKKSVGYFVRSKDRDAPHNLYISSAELARATSDLATITYDHPEVGFLFKSDVPVSDRPGAQEISYYFLYENDMAGWSYDPKTNGYLRTRRSKPARDAASKQQLWAKDVIVIEVQEARIPGDEKGRIDQDVIGSGSARLFMDGQMHEVTWRKDTPAGMLSFYDSTGTEIRLNAGPVWIVALPSLDNLTVK